jgi:glycosyltransferase involved in cell wall biosynthesis
MGPRVSVIIPTYNRATLVSQAINSALSQTRPPDEVLVVDDGSTDNTAEVVTRLAGPIRYLRKTNGGVSSARNVAIAQATGDVLFFLDSDDYWESTWLSLALEIFASRPECGAVCSNIKFVDDHGVLLRTSEGERLLVDGHIPLPKLFRKSLPMGSNLAVRSNVFEKIGGFDESLTTGEDVDIGIRIAAVTQLRVVEAAVAIVLRSAGSLSGRINTGNRLRVFDKFEREHTVLAGRYAAELREARAATALDYSLDLTWSRQLPAAWERARLAWSYQPSWPVGRQLAKIALLSVLGRLKRSST